MSDTEPIPDPAVDDGLGSPETDDALTLLDNMQPFLEAVRGMVAVFIADGFRPDQARDLVTAMFRAHGRDDLQ